MPEHRFHWAAVGFWNYALYCGAIAAAVLILLDLPQPSGYAVATTSHPASLNV